MFLPQYIEALGIQLLINPSGIYVQELVGSRFLSRQVRIGRLTRVDGTVQPEFTEWQDHSVLLDRRDLLQKQIKAKLEIKKSPEVNADAIDNDLQSLNSELDVVNQLISEHPISSLVRLNGKVINAVYKLVGSANFKHELECLPDGSVRFTNYVTNQAFLEAQAKDLAKRFNEHLESQGAETGYMDLATARAVIAKRFSQPTTSKGKARLRSPKSYPVNAIALSPLIHAIAPFPHSHEHHAALPRVSRKG